MNDPYSFYKQNQIANATQEELMLQLLQGALIRVKGAREMWHKGEKVRAMEMRSRAQDIICYLDETLDFENGGDMAYELDALYAFMNREILRSARERDFEILANVEDVLNDLYVGFRDAVEEYKKAKTGAAEAAVENAYERIAVGD